MSAQQILTAQQAAWQSQRPPYEPTLQDQIHQLQDTIAWLEYTYLTTPDFQKQMPKQDFYEFLQKLQTQLDDLIKQTD